MTSPDVSKEPQGRQDLEVDLRQIHAGRVLDAATGEGGFAQFLADHLGGFEEIVGVDLLPPSDDPESVFRLERVLFAEMDAEELAFNDGSFDVVSVSSALHHFPDPGKILAEMTRVLAPGGCFIVRETHRGVESEPERTDMALHHWVAEVDRLLGSYHAVTYTRSEILELVERLDLRDVRIYDVRNNDSDPFDAEALRMTEASIDEYLHTASDLPCFTAVQEEAQRLRGRLRDVGIQWEPEVFVIARKP